MAKNYNVAAYGCGKYEAVGWDEYCDQQGQWAGQTVEGDWTGEGSVSNVWTAQTVEGEWVVDESGNNVWIPATPPDIED